MSPDDGKVVKAVAVISSSGAMEEIVLEELDVFQVTAHADAVGPLIVVATTADAETQRQTGSDPNAHRKSAITSSHSSLEQTVM